MYEHTFIIVAAWYARRNRGKRCTPHLDKYKKHGFIWTLESCEMEAPDIYRTF
jgi:hypothetical protein